MAASAKATPSGLCLRASCKPVCAPVWSAARPSLDASVIEADARIARRTEDKEPPDDWDAPGKVTRPVREYLDQLDQAAGLTPLPGEMPQPAKSLSLTDPTAALTSKGKSKIAFAYGTNYLIDTKAAVILDVEASPARWTAEVAATRVMIDRTKSRFDLQPEKLAADTAYGSGGILSWLMERGIEPHISVFDRSAQTNGMFTSTTLLSTATTTPIFVRAAKPCHSSAQGAITAF
jgi:hypothetical protein